mgnify:CR=1 FL=1
MTKENKGNKGIISVEATIVLVTTLFLILFLLDFGYVFRAKNYMSYVIMQTGQGVAFQTYKYGMEESEETFELVRNILSLFNYKSDSSVIRTAINSNDYELAIKQYMLGCITTEDELKKYGIDSANIEVVKVETEDNDTVQDIRVVIKYQVDFPFKVFNIENIVLQQQTLAGMWKLE